MAVDSAAHRIETAREGGFRAWVLHDEAADVHATWVPGAGMLGASLIHRGEELLWQGAGVLGYARARRFMGIPLLHPWANRLDGYQYRAGGHDVALVLSCSPEACSGNSRHARPKRNHRQPDTAGIGSGSMSFLICSRQHQEEPG